MNKAYMFAALSLTSFSLHAETAMSIPQLMERKESVGVSVELAEISFKKGQDGSQSIRSAYIQSATCTFYRNKEAVLSGDAKLVGSEGTSKYKSKDFKLSLNFKEAKIDSVPSYGMGYGMGMGSPYPSDVSVNIPVEGSKVLESINCVGNPGSIDALLRQVLPGAWPTYERDVTEDLTIESEASDSVRGHI